MNLFRKSLNFVCLPALIGFLFVASQTEAYTVQTGDQIIRSSMGLSSNFMRYEVVTKETPPNAFLTRVGYEYALDGPWNVVGHLTPGFADGFVDLRLGGGAKYRLIQLDMPLIPFAEAQVVTAFGLPTRYQELHFNLGVRGALGADYFVMRQLAIGFELGWEFSGLFAPEIAPEMSAEGLLSLAWKF